jgi:hypothetical protein
MAGTETCNSTVPDDCGSVRESLDSDEEAGWNDWTVTPEDREAEETECVQCLFCSETRPSAASVFNHCSEQHSFDFMKVRREYRLDFYDCLRLINYTRSQVYFYLQLTILVRFVSFPLTVELHCLI